jgi:ferrous iron transport protein B
VVKTQALSGTGPHRAESSAISREEVPQPKWQSAVIPEGVRAALESSRGPLCQTGAIHAKASLLEPLYLLSDHDPTHYGLADAQTERVLELRRSIDVAFPGWEDRPRHRTLPQPSKNSAPEVLTRPDQEIETITTRLDRVLLHPVLGMLNLVMVFLLLGYCIFSLAAVPMGWIDGLFGQIGAWVESVMAPGDLRDLMVNGVVSGVGGVVIFLPQIVILFFFIGLMEDTGYMARLAFIMDWLMSKVGLNGKSFLPFLSSYACAVPGIMATRTIDSPKDRLVTILIAPLASCSARLPVYGLLIGLLPRRQSAGQAGLMHGDLCPRHRRCLCLRLALQSGSCAAPAPHDPGNARYKCPAIKSILLHVWQRAGPSSSVQAPSSSASPSSSGPPPPTRRATGPTNPSSWPTAIAGRAGHLIEPSSPRSATIGRSASASSAASPPARSS